MENTENILVISLFVLALVLYVVMAFAFRIPFWALFSNKNDTSKVDTTKLPLCFAVLLGSGITFFIYGYVIARQSKVALEFAAIATLMVAIYGIPIILARHDGKDS